MAESTTFVALDQHAATTVAVVLLPGQRTPALNPMTSGLGELRRLVRRLGAPTTLRCCDGPCGDPRISRTVGSSSHRRARAIIQVHARRSRPHHV